MILDSASKLIYHYDKLHALFHHGKTHPVHITVGLTNYCNHKCVWCYIDFIKDIKHQINADIDKMIEALRIAKIHGAKAMTIVGDGEPTLHPQFGEFLERVSHLGYDIGLFTNGSWKRECVTDAIKKYCRFVRFSMDAASQSTHFKTHLTHDFSMILENIRKVVHDKRDDLTVGVQFAFNQDNIEDIEKASTLFKSLHVNYLAYKPVYKNELNVSHKENLVASCETRERLEKAKKEEDESFKIYWKEWQLEALVYNKDAKRGYDVCRAIWLSPYFDENGNVEFCGNIKSRGFTIGNIYEKSFDEIWMGKTHLEKVASLDLKKCPVGCRLHGLNLKLESIAHPDTNSHTNFI